MGRLFTALDATLVRRLRLLQRTHGHAGVRRSRGGRCRKGSRRRSADSRRAAGVRRLLRRAKARSVPRCVGQRDGVCAVAPFAMGTFACAGLRIDGARASPKGIHVAHFCDRGGIRASAFRRNRPPDALLDPDANRDLPALLRQREALPGRSNCAVVRLLRPSTRDLVARPSIFTTRSRLDLRRTPVDHRGGSAPAPLGLWPIGPVGTPDGQRGPRIIPTAAIACSLNVPPPAGNAATRDGWHASGSTLFQRFPIAAPCRNLAS